MLKRFALVMAISAAVALVAGCREGAQTGAATQANAPAAAPQAPPPMSAASQPAKPSAGQEEIVVTVTLPPRGERLATEAVSGHGASCPQSAVSGLLGVEITSPHGVVIGRVLPDGLAAKAGIRPGDSITKVNGEAITCPRTFLPYIQRSDKPVDVKLTIVRRKGEAQQTAATTGKPAGK